MATKKKINRILSIEHYIEISRDSSNLNCNDGFLSTNMELIFPWESRKMPYAYVSRAE